MTYTQIIVLALIVVVGVAWVVSILTRPVSVENKESVERTIMTAMAMASKHGGSVSITYIKGGVTITYYPEEEDDEPVQDGD